MTAPARRLFFAALVVGLLALGLVIVPDAVAADGDLAVNNPAPVAEPAGSRTVTFTITLVRDPGNTSTVDVDYLTPPMSGTATANVDYLPVNGTAIFTNNETTETVSVTVLGDSLDEDDETFNLVLSSPNGGQFPGGVTELTGTATITDNDGPPRVSIGGAVIDEGDTGTTQARFTVALSSPSGRAVSVRWSTANGSATGGQDFTAAADQTISFDPGAVSRVISIPVAGDVLDEIDEETFTVNLKEPTNAILGPAPTGTGRILDDDDLPTVSIGDASGPEGGQADFTVSLAPASGRVVTVSATTVGGTATPGTDYTGTSGEVRFEPGQTARTFSVPLLADSADEPDETFQATISGAQAAIVGRATGTGTIVDTNPGPELSIRVDEPDGHIEGDVPGTMTFTVELTGGSDQLVRVDYQAVDQTAKAGQDYTLAPAFLTFSPLLPTEQQISVAVTGDNLAELNETFTVRLANPTGGANLASGKGQATGTIIDDDGVPAAVSVADAAPVVEDTQGAMAVFTVTLSPAVPQPVIVSYTTRDGTARAGEDYVGSQGTLTFAPNDTSEQVQIPILPDSLDEEDTETFTLELSDPINAQITEGGADPVGTGSITDDDPLPTVAIRSDVDLEEGNETPSTANVVVELSTASGRQVTVDFTVGAENPDNLATTDATVDVDYRAQANGTLTFPAGQTTRRIPVEALPDDLDEDPEVLVVTLSAPTNSELGAKAGGVVTIEDGDLPPEVSITGPDPVVEPTADGTQVQA
ncbi:MAG: Calx-beta domain-containing protein, partial [Acidimicrobiia bacterium]